MSMNTVELMAANHTLQKVASRAPGGFAYDFSKVAPPLPKFAASARPVSLAPAKPTGGMDMFRMKSHPPVAQAGSVTAQSADSTKSATPIGTPIRLRSGAGAGARMVQSELRLDAVKVKRNDLSETDFEIVAPQPAREPGAMHNDSAKLAWAGWLARMKGAVRAWI